LSFLDFFKYYEIISGMAPFIELKRELGQVNAEELQGKDVVVGEVEKRATAVHIVGEDRVVRYRSGEDGVVLEKEAGAEIFDRRGLNGRKGIVYLSEADARVLWGLQLGLCPGAFADVLEGVWRRMEVQAGKKNQISGMFGDFFRQ